MKTLSLITFVALISCQKENIEPPKLKTDYTLSLKSRVVSYDLTASDSLDLFSGGKKVGLTLFFVADGFKLRAYYRYKTGQEDNAIGFHNGSTFSIRDGEMFICNRDQNVPVQMTIIQTTK